MLCVMRIIYRFALEILRMTQKILKNFNYKYGQYTRFYILYRLFMLFYISIFNKIFIHTCQIFLYYNYQSYKIMLFYIFIYIYIYIYIYI